MAAKSGTSADFDSHRNITTIASQNRRGAPDFIAFSTLTTNPIARIGLNNTLASSKT